MNKTSTKKITTSPEQQMNASDDTNEFPYEPGNNVITNILNYSKALSVRKSKSGENIEIVLN